MKSSNRYFEAFKENFNLVGLAGVAAVAMATTTVVPLLIGLVVEAAYLLFYADSRWYDLRQAKKFDAEIEARRTALKNQILPQLQPAMRSRFLRLEDVRRGITENASDNSEWFREVLRKLDFLLEKWLQFASKDVQFRTYLEATLRDECGVSMPQNTFAQTSATPSMPRGATTSARRGGLAGAVPPAPGAAAPPMHPQGRGTGAIKNALIQGLAPHDTSGANLPASPRDPNAQWTSAAVARIEAHYDGEMAGIRAEISQSDSSTQAVLEKRVEVLGRRREFVGKIGRIQSNLNHQLNLLEDSFGLVSDEIRARPPQQVLSDIEDVVSQTNTMTQLLEEVAPYEQLLTS